MGVAKKGNKKGSWPTRQNEEDRREKRKEKERANAMSIMHRWLAGTVIVGTF